MADGFIGLGDYEKLHVRSKINAFVFGVHKPNPKSDIADNQQEKYPAHIDV